MLSNKIKFTYLLLTGAVTIGMVSCNDDDDDDVIVEPNTEKIDFEDITVGSEGYWSGDKTGVESPGEWGATNYTGSFTSNTASFENIFSISEYGTSWKGFAYSTLADTSVKGIYENDMYLYGNSGANGSKTFAVAFSDSATITFEKEVNLYNVQVNNNTYTYKVIRDGNAYTDGPFKEGSWFTVKFTGFNEDGEKVGEQTFYLADYRKGKTYICQNWTNVNLTKIKGAKKLVLTFDGSDKGSFGLNTPSYVCIDNLAYLSDNN